MTDSTFASLYASGRGQLMGVGQSRTHTSHEVAGVLWDSAAP